MYSFFCPDPRLFRSLDVDFLQLLDAEHVEHQILVEGFGLALPDLLSSVWGLKSQGLVQYGLNPLKFRGKIFTSP